MAITLLFVAVLVFGVILAAIGAVLLIRRKSKLAGWIILALGLLTSLLSILGFLSLVITSSTMG